MSVMNCEKLENSLVALTVEVSAENFEAAVTKAYQKMRKDIRIPGFRPGKAPRKIIEGMHGAEVFFEEAINIALPDAYGAAVEEKELNVVGYPEVELVEAPKAGENKGFTFKATVPVYPEVKLGQYKGLSAPKAVVAVTAEDVDYRLKELADRNTRLVSVDRAAENGDTVVIDFEGFLNGKPFDGGKADGHALELGSGQFVPGFEEQLVGMSAGEEKDINITFPEDYHEELAGKAVVFHVKTNEVKVKEVPVMDDEFAKDVSEFDTLAELRADLEKKAVEEREAAATRGFEDSLMEQVGQNVEADVPAAMVESQIDRFMDNFKQQMGSQGISYEQYLQMTGLDDAKMRDDARGPAEKQVRLNLAIAAIINEEKLEASAEEVEAEFKKLSERYGMDVDMVKRYLAEDDVRAQLLNEKAIGVVRDSATATEPAPAEETEEAKDEKPKKAAAKKTAKKEEDGEEKPAKKPAARKKKAEETAE